MGQAKPQTRAVFFLMGIKPNAVHPLAETQPGESTTPSCRASAGGWLTPWQGGRGLRGVQGAAVLPHPPPAPSSPLHPSPQHPE